MKMLIGQCFTEKDDVRFCYNHAVWMFCHEDTDWPVFYRQG